MLANIAPKATDNSCRGWIGALGLNRTPGGCRIALSTFLGRARHGAFARTGAGALRRRNLLRRTALRRADPDPRRGHRLASVRGPPAAGKAGNRRRHFLQPLPYRPYPRASVLRAGLCRAKPFPALGRAPSP